MSLANINRANLAAQLAKAKASGAVQVTESAPPPPPPPKPEPVPVQTKIENLPPTVAAAKASRRGIENSSRQMLKLDYEVLSAIFGVEINDEMSPLRIQALVRRRLDEMRRDNLLGSIPDVVWEMLRGLDVAANWDITQYMPGALQCRKREDSVFVVKADSKAQGLQMIARRPIQMFLQEVSRSGGEWSLNDGSMIIKGDVIRSFSFHQLQRIWNGCVQTDIHRVASGKLDT